MDHNHNVFIKLQIEKNQHSKGLMIKINFDRDAPNFSIDERGINWTPNFEELDFVIETYEVISNNKNKIEKSNDEIKNTIPEDLPYNDKEEYKSEPFKRKTSVFEPLKGEIDFKNDQTDPVFEKREEEKEIFVQADDKTIDDALKRKGVGVGEALILDKEDKSIIDKMLKKRGKNKENNES